MTRKERYEGVLKWFKENNPNPETELNYTNAYQLIVAVILSAQCTDKRVNMVTPALFEAFPTVESLAASSPEEILHYIKSVSYPNNKAKHLHGMAKAVVLSFEGQVPEQQDELVKLPGVGRKTANVVASVFFDVPAIAVDTHVFRVSRRIGLVPQTSNTPDKVESQLTKYIPQDLWSKAHHWLILHGRYVCVARSPLCSDCGISEYCWHHSRNIKRLKISEQ